MSQPSTRRDFLATASATAGTVLAMAPAPVRADGEENIVMAAIGCGGQGSGLAKSFAAQPDVRLAYVCDPDAHRAAELAAAIEKISGRKPKAIADLREALADPTVAACTVATPDHWHGPATLLALAAGKHVYVEKPCAHNIREGRLMVEAAKAAGRVVQVGTQSRSIPHVRRAVDLLREGAIGDVLVAKAWNSQRRNDIGHGAPGEPPADFNYDLWLGPAPEVPFQANRGHYNWHWWYAFGTGDMGNDGVHEVDVARWGLGVETHPTSVSAAGGKFYFDDDQQFPDTQYVLYEYPGDGLVGHRRQLIFELRIWSPYRQEGHENGVAFYGTKGMLVLGKRTGYQLFGPKNELRDQVSGAGDGAEHHRNFLDAVKGAEAPHAPIEVGHLSAALCHLGNIAVRVGRQVRFDGDSEQITGDDEANALVRREYRDHWATPQGV